MKKIILSIILVLSFESFSSIELKMSLNGQPSLVVEKNDLGKPFLLDFLIWDNQANESVKLFKPMHGKWLHLLIVKSDLSSFRHVHPYFEPVSGRFQIPLNLKTIDPDNFQNQNVFDEPGMYMVMAEFDIPFIGMKMRSQMVHVKGESKIKPMVLDQKIGDKIIIYLDPQGNKLTKKIETIGTVKAELVQKFSIGRDGVLIENNLFIYQFDGVEFSPIEKVEPWLNAGGHGVWFSQKKHRNGKMSMGHFHAELPPNGNQLIFPFYDKSIFNTGIQKVWFQINFSNKIWTLPFVIEYKHSINKD